MNCLQMKKIKIICLLNPYISLYKRIYDIQCILYYHTDETVLDLTDTLESKRKEKILIRLEISTDLGRGGGSKCTSP